MTAALAGLVLGVAGSAHCAAMCGPLAIAMRGAPRSAGTAGPSPWLLFAAYHTARLGAYALAGLAAGSLGHGVALLGFGRVLSAVAGVALVLSAVASLWPARRRVAATALSRFLGRAAAAARRGAERHPLRGAIGGGLVNALLPCGMLYGAMAAAAALGHTGEATLFMALFGLGTLPAVAACWAMADALGPLLRRQLRFALPWTLAAVGVLLIARGLAAPSGHEGGHGAGTRAPAASLEMSHDAHRAPR